VLDARPVRGFYRTLRSRADALLIAILFAVPWIRIGGEPLILFDIPQRQFHVFGRVLFPQELFLAWLILAGLALALFFFTALAGRLWCGWACPQTVFTDVFAWVARRIQGWTRSGPPKAIATWRKVATHAAWIALSAVIGLHLVGYFHPIGDMLRAAAHAEWTGPSMTFWIAGATLCYLDFAIVRQTFCKYLCPYARFQSVLLDRDSLVVGYDPTRGEPRGKARAAGAHRSAVASAASGQGGAAGAHQLGDCVDCGLCVAVCPTGIDIRKGLQLECIGCTQCIDACDGVMTRLGRPTGLIAYRSLASLDGRRTRFLRPRVVLYGVLLVAACIGFVLTAASRQTLSLEVERNRAMLYQQMPDGRVANAFTLHLQNRDRREHAFRIRLDAGDEYELVAGVNPVRIPATATVTASIFVIAKEADEDAASSTSHPIRFVLEDLDDARRAVVRDSTFVSPPSARRESRREESPHAG
jgi:cytochrome c oxidase accessory protein FixG